MLLSVEVELKYRCEGSCDALLQIAAAETNKQTVLTENITITPQQPLSHINSNDGIGKRVWLNIEDLFHCNYQATIEVTRKNANLSELKRTPLRDLDGDTVRYIMPSRYCHLEKFDGLMPNQFNNLQGGELVVALARWVENEFTYLAGTSDALTTAHDTMKSKQGVCRDFAHVLISMLRVSAIPARMVSAYGPNVSPPDFHALVEVYLEGAWYLVDPTGMTKPDEIAIIGIGRDAADISFLTSYGLLHLERQSVLVNAKDHSTASEA